MLRSCAVSLVVFCLSFNVPARPALHQAAHSAQEATLSLFTAAAAGNRTAAINLLAAGADARAKNSDGKFPFELAMDADHDALTAILLKAAGGIAGTDERGWTPLNWAIFSGDWELVQEFIREGADFALGKQNAWDVAQLMESEKQLLEIIIADKGVDARVGRAGETVLMQVARTGHAELVRKLLDGGADPNVVGDSYISALMLAAENGHTEILEMLIAEGAHLNDVEDDWNYNALMLAAENGHIETVKLLVENDAYLYEVTMIEKLLVVENGAPGSSDYYDEYTARELAEKSGHKEIAAILRAAEQAAIEGK